MLKRDRRCPPPSVDQSRRRGIKLAVFRLEEMILEEKGRDTVIGVVVNQERPDHRLFRLEVMGRLTKHEPSPCS